ncbi:ATP-dependent DNA helicase RecQ family protein [Monocercomonoides exilis]|uniref:ATP-dependent DNA helicase RecQ family protein n=1 Tax=Monocercomonoides exilis TaxID=2049356 RepID=UPI003559E5F8|nr:ATP-dependent DNA helicase RecQ family protein [Monocercomonoides exilis]|eukprot:MONOS_378.1-p1 / transcript=MONOS_378.1 / gene=MONOS_378 / organism=Monocercomonoides_exilis_PA203 / gene_product=ATP-dependent DNA helicase RecQ family protein / transcript_product=ATP-dependent DNA helicase RecQ family protein / location=Mono_scaffold00006:123328-128031(-) / protein_length=1442 / sequence_SO=supercontig / SO=protein_coding / is_pseudo=false
MNESFDDSKLYEALKKLGILSFRGKQYECIKAILDGNDVFALWPTGAGKSLVYQLPALVTNKMSIVVSPLIALMIDQVNNLQARGVDANVICSTKTRSENAKIFSNLNQRKPSISVLYVTPEMVATDRFQSVLKHLVENNCVGLFAIDEAHMISQWGHQFRPEYRQLGILRTLYPKIPIAALTATAVPQIREDIKKQLNIPNAIHFITTFNRPNIYYTVTYKDLLKNPMEYLFSFVKRVLPSCIGALPASETATPSKSPSTEAAHSESPSHNSTSLPTSFSNSKHISDSSSQLTSQQQSKIDPFKPESPKSISSKFTNSPSSNAIAGKTLDAFFSRVINESSHQAQSLIVSIPQIASPKLTSKDKNPIVIADDDNEDESGDDDGLIMLQNPMHSDKASETEGNSAQLSNAMFAVPKASTDPSSDFSFDSVSFQSSSAFSSLHPLQPSMQSHSPFRPASDFRPASFHTPRRISTDTNPNSISPSPSPSPFSSPSPSPSPSPSRGASRSTTPSSEQKENTPTRQKNQLPPFLIPPPIPSSAAPTDSSSSFSSLMNLPESFFSKGLGIVYCRTRAECDSTAFYLQTQGVRCLSYHAGLSDKERISIQNRWGPEYPVIVGTIALGMGIDQPNIRFVAHTSIPESPESFYQESGRGGRDGLPSWAMLMYSRSDAERIRWIISKESERGEEKLRMKYKEQNSNKNSESSIFNGMTETEKEKVKEKIFGKSRSKVSQMNAFSSSSSSSFLNESLKKLRNETENKLEKLTKMMEICETTECRRRLLLNYLGEEKKKSSPTKPVSNLFPSASDQQPKPSLAKAQPLRATSPSSSPIARTTRPPLGVPRTHSQTLIRASSSPSPSISTSPSPTAVTLASTLASPLSPGPTSPPLTVSHLSKRNSSSVQLHPHIQSNPATPQRKASRSADVGCGGCDCCCFPEYVASSLALLNNRNPSDLDSYDDDPFELERKMRKKAKKFKSKAWKKKLKHDSYDYDDEDEGGGGEYNEYKKDYSDDDSAVEVSSDEDIQSSSEDEGMLLAKRMLIGTSQFMNDSDNEGVSNTQLSGEKDEDGCNEGNMSSLSMAPTFRTASSLSHSVSFQKASSLKSSSFSTRFSPSSSKASSVSFSPASSFLQTASSSDSKAKHSSSLPSSDSIKSLASLASLSSTTPLVLSTGDMGSEATLFDDEIEEKKKNTQKKTDFSLLLSEVCGSPKSGQTTGGSSSASLPSFSSPTCLSQNNKVKNEAAGTQFKSKAFSSLLSPLSSTAPLKHTNHFAQPLSATATKSQVESHSGSTTHSSSIKSELPSSPAKARIDEKTKDEEDKELDDLMNYFQKKEREDFSKFKKRKPSLHDRVMNNSSSFPNNSFKASPNHFSRFKSSLSTESNHRIQKPQGDKPIHPVSKYLDITNHKPGLIGSPPSSPKKPSMRSSFSLFSAIAMFGGKPTPQPPPK